MLDIIHEKWKKNFTFLPQHVADFYIDKPYCSQQLGITVQAAVVVFFWLSTFSSPMDMRDERVIICYSVHILSRKLRLNVSRLRSNYRAIVCNNNEHFVPFVINFLQHVFYKHAVMVNARYKCSQWAILIQQYFQLVKVRRKEDFLG